MRGIYPLYMCIIKFNQKKKKTNNSTYLYGLLKMERLNFDIWDIASLVRHQLTSLYIIEVGRFNPILISVVLKNKFDHLKYKMVF